MNGTATYDRITKRLSVGNLQEVLLRLLHDEPALTVLAACLSDCGTRDIEQAGEIMCRAVEEYAQEEADATDLAVKQDQERRP